MVIAPLRVMWFVPPVLSAVSSTLLDNALSHIDARRNQSSDEQFDALVAGDVDAVVTSMDNVIAWNRRSGPRDFRIVAQIEQTTSLAVIGQRQFSMLADLRGADILVDAPGNGFVIALQAMLNDAGIKPDSYQLIPAGGVKERFDQLIAAKGAATLLGPPFDSMALNLGLVSLASVQAHYPAFPGQGIVTRQGLSDARPGIANWLHDLELARRAMDEQPTAAQIAVSSAGYPPSAVGAMIASRPNTLRPSRGGIELLIEHRRALELAGGDESYRTLVDDTLLPA